MLITMEENCLFINPWCVFIAEKDEKAQGQSIFVAVLDSTYYGFGLMDAGKAVRLGELWRTLPPHHRCTTQVKQLSR